MAVTMLGMSNPSPIDRSDSFYLVGKRTAGPVIKFFPLSYVRSLMNPQWLPQGATDVRTVLANNIDVGLDATAIPVVLVHGTWMNSFDTFAMVAPALAEGRPVFSIDYGADPDAIVTKARGIYGNRDLALSFDEIADLLDAFRAHTGIRQIDLVGHSQGALHIRKYANAHIDALYESALADGQSEADAEDFAAANTPVRAVVSMAGNHHGTSGGLARKVLKPLDNKGVPVRRTLDRIFGRAGVQQSLNSVYITDFNAVPRGLTRRGPHYFNLATPFDTIVTPWDGEFLPEVEGHFIRNVNNAEMADSDWSDHLSLLYSPNAIEAVVDFLDELDAASVGAAKPAAGKKPGQRVRVLPFVGALPRRQRRQARTRRR